MSKSNKAPANRRRFTEAFLKRQALRRKGEVQTDYWDRQSMLGLRVGAKLKTWRVQARDPHGRVVFRKIGTYPAMNYLEAITAGAEMIELIKEGKHQPAANVIDVVDRSTLRGVMEAYFIARRNTGFKSEADYRGRIELHLKAFLDKPATDLTEQALELVKRRMADKPKPFNSVRTHIKSMYNEARIVPNPADFVKPYAKKTNKKMKARKCHIRTRDEFALVIKHAMTWRNQTVGNMVRLQAYTGCRQGEIQQLKWDDITESYMKFSETKNGDDHFLPVCNIHREILAEQRRLTDELELEPYRAEHVFPAARRRTKVPWLSEPKDFWIDVNRQIGRNKDTIGSHDLRRWFVIQAGKVVRDNDLGRKLTNHTGEVDAYDGYRLRNLTVDDLRQPMKDVCSHLLDLATATPENQPASAST